MFDQRLQRIMFPLIIAAGLVIMVSFCQISSSAINGMMPSDSRPQEIAFPLEMLSPEEFETVANQLENGYALDFKHIEIFRENDILAYNGPETCLRCHEEIIVQDHLTQEEKEVNLMENLLSSAHYKFHTKARDNVYGFNGELADNFRMGKIDRPCPSPGSFAMTAWAEIVETSNGHFLSEGCGQCHIGGQYQAPLGDVMPGYKTLNREKASIADLSPLPSAQLRRR